MGNFQPYMHLERIGTDETEGLLEGTCYIQPKLDGTNASVWCEKTGEIRCGSRHRELSLDSDNAGFYAAMIEQRETWFRVFEETPALRFYGEWLVPHTFRGYRADAWHQFYVFDVSDGRRFLRPPDVASLCELLGLNHIPVQAVILQPTQEQLLREMGLNHYLCEDGKGPGEGIVIKNYDFVNRYGHCTFGKLVRNEFKERNQKVFGPREYRGESAEANLVARYLPESLVQKVKAKLELERGGWTSKLIGELLGRVYYDFIHEELWNALKAEKNPTVDFKRLQGLVVARTKELLPEVFGEIRSTDRASGGGAEESREGGCSF